MGYVFGALALIFAIFWAIFKAGWLTSLLVFGITALILVWYFKKKAKASQKDSNGYAKQGFQTFSKTVMVICVIIFIVGILMWLIGLSGGTEMLSASGDHCGICGGDGRFSGSECWACDGTGAEISTSIAYGSSTSRGFLMAAAAALVWLVIFMTKNDLPKKEN